MARHFLFSTLFVSVFAAPTFAASPSDRYQAALDLLTQSEDAVTAAYFLGGNPDNSATLLTIDFARNAAQDAVNSQGGAARRDALAGAQTAYLGASMAAALAMTEPDPVVAAYYAFAADTANQAAFLLDRNVGK
jgi:hypothetical protein